jgi:hypothetical protein
LIHNKINRPPAAVVSPVFQTPVQPRFIINNPVYVRRVDPSDL